MTVVKLDKKQIDALADDQFAVPSKRKLRINDAHHTRLAWYNVETTQGSLSKRNVKRAETSFIARSSSVSIPRIGTS